MRTQVFAGVLAGFLLIATAAIAGTFIVTPDGADGAGCGTPAAPCKTVQGAVNQADVGGTILLSQPGNYGAATINKSLNIRGVQGAGIFSPGARPCINWNGTVNSVLTIEELACDMDGAASDGLVFNSGHKLRLDNVVIRGATGTSCGVRVKPSSGNDELIINNSTFSENGTTGTNDGGGICLLPTGTAHVSTILRNSMLENDRHGLVSAPAGSATSSLLIDGSDFSNNAGGIFSVGPNSTACIRNSTISGNTFQGLGGGGGLLNGGGNTVWNNITNGTFSGNCP